MKLKKLLSAAVAGVVAASALATAASAATIVATPTSSSNYLINLTASCTFAETEFTSNDSFTLNGFDGAQIKLTDGSTTQTAVLSNCSLNGAKMTQAVGVFGFSNSTNQITYGKLSSLTWKGTAKLTDKTVDPNTVFNLASLTADLQLGVTINGKLETLNFNTTTATTGTESSSSVIKPGTLTTKIFNNGLGLKVSERNDISNAKGNFTVVCTLANKITSSASVFSFNTDISDSNGVATLGQIGDQSVTFTVPSSYFYNKDYGVMFSTMNIVSAYDFSSISLTYNTGSSSSTTTPDEEDVTDDTTSSDDEFVINVPKLTLNTDATFKLTTNYSNVKWKTSSSKVCKVYTSGKIKGVKAGTATITGTNSDGDTVKCKVTVIDSSKPSDTFAQTSTKKATVYTGKRYTLKTTLPSGSTDVVTWVSSDTSIATVSSTGKVSTKSTGVVTITAISSSGLSSSRTLTVKKPSITLSKSSATVNVGDTYTISATAKPSKTISYESLDESVATVTSKGVVKGISEGKAKIEVSANGVYKVFTITVK